MTFKVGDRVRRIKYNNGERFDVGAVGVITEVDTGLYRATPYRVDGKTWNYEDCLELVTPTPKFKVGDRVRVIANDRTFHHGEVGECGKIADIAGSDGNLAVVLDSGIQQWIPPKDLELEQYEFTTTTNESGALTPTGVEAALKGVYPHGHPDFIPDMVNILSLHSAKNFDYASGGDPLGNFDRVAAIKQLYPGFPWDSPFGVAWGNMLKQFDAVMWGLCKDIQHKVEGLDERLKDIIVYSAIGRIILRRKK